jgi:predicted transcriptional regulator
MTTPLDDVEFLARSEHRVRVLETLHRGGTTRSDLRDRTGIAQATLTRTLDDLVERRWARKRGRTYELTPLGEVLAVEFADLLETVETMQRLQSLADWLPALPFDLRLLADATVTLPTDTDVFAHVGRIERLLDGADASWILAGSVFREALERQHRRSTERGQRQVAVLSAAALDRARLDSELRPLAADLLASGCVELYRYDGTVPVMLGLVDKMALVVPLDENGVPRGLVESTEPTVREWVETTLRGYLEAAERVPTAAFAE